VTIETLHADKDGDTIYFEPTTYGQGALLGVNSNTHGDGYGVYLDRAGAFAVIARLTRYVEEMDEAARPSFKVGDRVEVHGWSPVWDGAPATVTIAEYTRPHGGPYVRIRRDSDGATGGFYARNLRPLPAPSFKVGDRVRVVKAVHAEHTHGMTGAVGEVYAEPLTFDGIPHPYHVDLDGDAVAAAELESCTYAEEAATFKPGDLAIVGDNPGVNADGTGYVDEEFRGATVTVLAHDDVAEYWENAGELVHVRKGATLTNYIHVAHLTKAKAVPA
jgi:hypothetical protein